MNDPEQPCGQVSDADSIGIVSGTQPTTCARGQGIGEQIRALRYALELKDEPVLLWRLYRIYRMHGIPVPDDLLQKFDCLADRADRGAAAARADDAQRRAITLLEYTYAIEDGERPMCALRIASARSGISVNAIKTMASRLHIRTRPYRIRSGRFDADALGRASDPFGLAKERKNEGGNVARAHSRSNIVATVDSIRDPPDTTRIEP
jgi:hypothetical protein